MRKLLILASLVAALCSFALPAVAQTSYTDQVFPRFVNGQAGGGNFYQSKIHILPDFSSTATINCALRFYGMVVDMGTLGTGNLFNFSFQQNGGWVLLSSNPATQDLVGGHATLSCSTYVYAYVDYALYAPSGKLGGATVFGVREGFQAAFISDQGEPGSRLGIALANNTDLQRTYTVTAKNAAGTTIGTYQWSIPARTAPAKFLDEMNGLAATAGTASLVTIQSTDLSDFSAVGLRFVGSVFSTLPASQ